MKAEPEVLLTFITNRLIREPVRPLMTTEVRQVVESVIHGASHQAPDNLITSGASGVRKELLLKMVDTARLVLEPEDVLFCIELIDNVFNIDAAISIIDDSFKTRSTSLESKSELIVFGEDSVFVFHNVDSFLLMMNCNLMC
jgi:hypothetical protein